MTPILILHGWGWPASVPQWQTVKELLEKEGYNVFLPDLPGFGQSTPPPIPWTIDDFREWVRKYCQEYNLERVFLLGHSFGGSLAAKFTVKYPNMVEKLILIDSAGIRKMRLKKEIQKKVAHFLNKFSFLPLYPLARKLAYKTLFRSSDYLLTEGVMKETYLSVISEDISDDFAYVSVPTMLIWGKDDKITPRSHANFIKERILNSRLEIIPGVGHNPHKKCPEKLAEIIIRFLNS